MQSRLDYKTKKNTLTEKEHIKQLPKDWKWVKLGKAEAIVLRLPEEIINELNEALRLKMIISLNATK